MNLDCSNRRTADIRAADAENRIPDIKRYLYAAIIAQGCNIGLERMARLASCSDPK